jgi:hypothetical protein
MSFIVQDLSTFIQLLEHNTSWLAAFRRIVLPPELVAMPDYVIHVQQTTTREIQRLVNHVAEMTVEQQHTKKQQHRLASRHIRTDEEGPEDTSLQHDADQSDRDLYVRHIQCMAPALFNGGQGGSTDRPEIQQRLVTELGALLGEELLDASVNPFLADLIWWKGEEIAIIDVSRRVDCRTVAEAAQRAATLRRSGAHVIAVVIGDQWATEETREDAQRQHVEWKIGSDLSEGLLAFRKLSSSGVEQR